MLAEDPSGTAFRFAPLDGEAFRAALPETGRTRLPDSFIVLTVDGTVLTRSRAVRYVLRRLGGLWRVFAAVAGVVPARLLDRVYDGVARVRFHLFARPAEACPLLPRHLRERFAA